MKRAFVILCITLVSIVFAGSNVLAGKKVPPKSICFQIYPLAAGEYAGARLSLTIKNSGHKMKDIDTTVKFYAIHGALHKGAHYYPIFGSGYVYRKQYSQNYSFKGTLHTKISAFYIDFDDFAGLPQFTIADEPGNVYSMEKRSCREIDIDGSYDGIIIIW